MFAFVKSNNEDYIYCTYFGTAGGICKTKYEICPTHC